MGETRVRIRVVGRGGEGRSDREERWQQRRERQREGASERLRLE